MDVTGELIKVIGGIFGWIFFLMTLGILKNFICNGVSIAIAEFLLKCNDNEMREKVARWLGNGKQVLDHVKELEAKIEKSEK